VGLDVLFGDPRRGHPVAAFGRAATALEGRDYADSRRRGAGHAAACVLAVTAPAVLLHRRTRGRPPLEAAAVALTVWAVTGARSLHDVAERAAVSLDRHDLPAAREILPSLCGRDPSGLDAGEITRAVIESVAENTCDAAVAPLLWGAMGGIGGLAAYRAVNTLDAMVGHRSPRYLRFGWACARLDDAANWIPARVTAALAVACAKKGRFATLRTVLRDGGKHPSPNAGRCEAAFAGALGIRLGGRNIYGGVAELRPELGEGRAPEPGDIRRAILLSRAVTLAATALAVLVAGVMPDGRRSRSPRSPAPRWRPTTAREARILRRTGPGLRAEPAARATSQGLLPKPFGWHYKYPQVFPQTSDRPVLPQRARRASRRAAAGTPHNLPT
jgi:adenosylcobinamide-phosphate synthase